MRMERDDRANSRKIINSCSCDGDSRYWKKKEKKHGMLIKYIIPIKFIYIGMYN